MQGKQAWFYFNDCNESASVLNLALSADIHEPLISVSATLTNAH